MKVNNQNQSLRTPRALLRLGSLGSLGITLDKVLRAGDQQGHLLHPGVAERRPLRILGLPLRLCKPNAPKEFRGEFKPPSRPTSPAFRSASIFLYTARQAGQVHPS